jgi:glycerate kinase
MKILIAFDKFKDSLSAPQACELASHALAGRGDWALELAPLTDGGEGFAEILTLAAGGGMQTINVMGPRGEPTQANLGWVSLSKVPQAARQLLDLPDFPAGAQNRVAIVEMASASGLALLPHALRDPWLTTSFGTGQLLRAAAAEGACAIVLGVGGSATNDLGLGAVAALGLSFSSNTGLRLSPPVPAVWAQIDHIDGVISTALPPIRIACDVSNPLVGPRGCTAVFGPQKGLQLSDFERLEKAVSEMALRLCARFHKEKSLMDFPGNGAAGGIPFGLACVTPTRLMSGFEFVSSWLELDARIASADIVITGEGCFDASSLYGKGPGAIALRALELGKKVHVFAGQVNAEPRAGLELHAITPLTMPLSEALEAAPRLLTESLVQAFSGSAGG